jgi:hypothetical protein
LKAITERLRYARKLAARAEKRVNWHLFIEAHLTIETETTSGDDWD